MAALPLSSRSSVSVIVPTYNGEALLKSLVARLEPSLSSVTSDFEVIFINDGSTDGTWRVIQDLSDHYPWVHGISLMRNYGQHNAILCGLRAAQKSVIVTLDDDLQNPPEEIPALLAELDRGFDVVYGRPKRQQHGLMRDIASSVTKMALKGAMGAETARDISAFRAVRSEAAEGARRFHGPLVSIDVLLTWGTNRFSAVEVRHDPRTVGESTYTVKKLIAHALNMVTGFSTVPLQLASIIGFAFTIVGLGILVYVVGRYVLEGTTVPGFPFLASIIALFSGAQLFALGIIGEYLARMHFRTMDKPTYLVREELSDAGGANNAATGDGLEKGGT